MINACIFLLGILAHVCIAMTFVVFTYKPNKQKNKYHKSLTIEQGRILPNGERQYSKMTTKESIELPEYDLLDKYKLNRLLDGYN